MNNLTQITDYFFNDSSIKVLTTLEGSLYKDGILFLGCKAGPSQDEDNLLHEMAHLIEINDERIKTSGWGLTYPEVEVLGQVFREPNTIQGLMRELRVFAIQRHLFEMIQIPVEDNYWAKKAKILEWLQDFILIPSPREQRLLWCEEKMKELYQNYTKEKIQQEWNRKNNLLKG